MHKHRWRLVVFFSLLSAMLLSCGNARVAEPLGTLVVTASREESSSTGQPNIVTLTFVCNSPDRPTFASIANDFHALNPGIRIDLVDLETVVDLSSKPSMVDVTRQLVSAADIVYWTVVPEATQDRLLYDLSPFVEADSVFNPDDFFPHMLEAFQWDGGIWAMPSQATPTMIFYDKTAFDAAGTPAPKPGWTRDDFLTTAQQLTIHKDNKVARYGYVDLSSGMVNTFVLAPVSTEVGGTLALDSHVVADAVRWTTDLALRYRVTPNPWVPVPPAEGPWSVAQALVNDHRAAMWSDTLANYDYRSRTFELGVVPFPQTGERSTPAWMYGYMISARTPHPQEAWRWLAFLTHQRIMDPDAAYLDSVPARRSVAEQTHYWDRFDEETQAAVYYAAEHLLFPTQGVAATKLSLAVRRVFEGQPVEEALAEAQTAFEEHLAQIAQATPAPIVVATPRSEDAMGAVTISFAPAPEAEVQVYRALAYTFNQADAAVEVQIISPGQAQMADCFASEQSVAEPSSRVNLLNLQPLLEADSGFSMDDFHPRFLDAFRYEGDLWALPTQAQVQALFYNRDLFETDDVPPPAVGWTLDDFAARAVALTKGDGTEKQYGFLPLNGDAGDLPTFVALQGTALWDKESRPRFDAPEVVAAVRWYTDLALKHGVMPTFPADLPERNPAAQEARNALVRAGRVAMWTDFTGLDRSGVWPAGAQVGMAPLPEGAEKIADFLYEGLFITASTPHPEACWEWLKFVSGQVEPMRGLPARRSLLDSAALAGQVGDEAVETYRALLDYADLYRPVTVEAGNQMYWLYQAVANILAGTRPEVALAEAQAEAGK